MTNPLHLGNESEVFSLSQELARFRQHLEKEAGQPVYELEVNAALLLSDLAVFLGFGRLQHAEILGPTTVFVLYDWSDTQVRPSEYQHRPLGADTG